MDTYRLCRANNHSQCQPDHCKVRGKVEKVATECRNARAVLDYCRTHGIEWSRLGTELPILREAARYPLEKTKWLAEAFAIDSVIMMEAGYVTQQILAEQELG